MVCRELDQRLEDAAHRGGFVYSRYANDLTFSHAEPSAPVDPFLAEVSHHIDAEGFAVKRARTRVMRGNQWQVVTGLVVNKAGTHDQTDERISRRDLLRFRALLHHCQTEGWSAGRLTRSSGATR